MIYAIALLSAALSTGNAEFDKVAAEGAARITMNRFAAGLAQKGAGVSLAKEMLADPAGHSTKEKSEKLCRGLWTEAALAAYAQEAEKVRKRLDLSREHPLDMTKDARGAIEGKFLGVFEAERKKAVSEQAKTLVTALRPTETEFEAMKKEDLRRVMTERIVAERGKSLFEENRGVVTAALVDPMIESAESERNRQKEYIRRIKVDSSAPSKLRTELVARLEANVKEKMKDAGPAKTWGVFPSVKNIDIPQDVERRIVSRFVSSIGEVSLVIAPEHVRDVIEADPAAHAKIRSSEKIFVARYHGQVMDSAVEKLLSSAPEGERSEFKDALVRREGCDKVKKAVEKVVRRDAMPHWRTARAVVAKELAKRTWPQLMDGTWFPAAELADETAARSDYERAVREWRKIPAMEKLANAGKGRSLMEEAESEADGRVAAAFTLARSAVTAQALIVDEVAPEILADSCERKESFFRRTPNLSAITRRLEAAVRGRWGETRRLTLWPDGREPSNADKQHVELFPSVKRKVELVAREILKEMEADPEPEEDLEILSLSVRRAGKNVKVELRKGSETILSEDVPADDASFRKAMNRATRKLSADVLKLPRNSK